MYHITYRFISYRIVSYRTELYRIVSYHKRSRQARPTASPNFEVSQLFNDRSDLDEIFTGVPNHIISYHIKSYIISLYQQYEPVQVKLLSYSVDYYKSVTKDDLVA